MCVHLTLLGRWEKMCVRICTILLLFLFIPHRSFQFRLSPKHEKAAAAASARSDAVAAAHVPAQKSQFDNEIYLNKKRKALDDFRKDEDNRKDVMDVKLKHGVGSSRKKSESQGISLEALKVPLITLILVKLVNIKALAVLTLIGILVIKKAMLAAALFVPVVLGKLKGLIHKDDDHVYIHHEHDHVEQHGDWIKRYSHYRK